MADNLPEKSNNNVGNIFTQLVSAVKSKSVPDKDAEQIYEWLYAAAPYLIVAAIFWIIGVCCCRCLCGRRRSAGRMNAPGRRPTRLPRAAFERNPRGYFRDLRGRPNDFSYN
ncbi:hypothetical protein Lser_V15G15394 [Lactuca serriola]